MAEGKDKLSFLLYKNQRVMFDKLTDEQAGKLIKLIFKFVNCENPKESDDPMVNYGFAMIKSTLEIDLDRWKETSKKRSEAGRKHKGNQYTIQVEQMEQNGTNGTDKDNDNDNDKGNVKDNDKVNNSSLKESIKGKAADESSTSTPAIDKEKKNPEDVKHRRGSYGQVMLTDNEYKRLCDKFGGAYIDEIINALDESKKMTGNKNKWKEDNLVIQRAIRENWSLIRPFEHLKGQAAEPPEEIDTSWIDA